MSFSPIAIVGQGCVLPGAASPEALAALVAAKRNAVGRPPAGRFRLSGEQALGSPEWSIDRPWTEAGGYVTGFESVFSVDGFLIEPEVVWAMDPAFRWLLHAAREALRPVGHAGKSARAGLIIGNLSFPTATMARFAESVWLGDHPAALGGPARPDARNRFMSGLTARLAATALGLEGPAFALDAACASSLYAIKLACDRLHDESADLMLAGAINAADPLILHAGFSALAAMSKTGRCRPFNREADGLVPAEGAGIVALKRLADARAAGDRVLGVIRGIGLSNDGRGRGFLAPLEAGQVRAMRLAYDAADLRPSDVSLIECHATGTPVGDATEVRSMMEVFAGCDELPIGSLKSNLGHLVTVAGVAAIIKVLGAFAAGRRPPMIGTESPIEALLDSPFRLLADEEAWPSDRPRVAAVSAFGFGGNNAHMLVSEEGPRIAARVFMPAPASKIAIVGIGVRLGDRTGATEVARTLLAGQSWAAQPDEVTVALEGLRFPPKVLEQALPQQLMVLEAAREAIAGIDLPRERTGVFVGMGCDPEIARHGMRWRIADVIDTWSRRTGCAVPANWLAQARRALGPELTAEAVVGALPNIPANRINVQLDLAGPGHTVSAEQASGVVALEIAARALRERELDVAIVGAVDLSHEPVHRAALAELGLPTRTADGAVVLIIKRIEDARRDGDRVFAVLGDSETAKLVVGDGAADLFVNGGTAHAAAGLLHVAAAAWCVHYGARPIDGKVKPWLGSRVARTRTAVLGGGESSVTVVGDGAAAGLRFETPRLYVYAGEDRRAVLRGLAEGRTSEVGLARLVIVAANEAERVSLAAQARSSLERGGRMPEGVAYRDLPIGGELAFVFTGAAASYVGMGRELALALPDMVGHLAERFTGVEEATRWIYGGTSEPRDPLDQLWGSVFVCQLHAEVSRRVLGLTPDATVGYSSGESNALFATGAWRDIDAMVHESRESAVFNRDIAGEFAAVRRVWGHYGVDGTWQAWSVAAPVERVREALRGESVVHLTIINTPEDCVIGGEAAACERVLAKLGRDRAVKIEYAMAAHCPEIEEIREAWYAMHDRETWAVPGVRHYSAGSATAFRASAGAAAAAITAQAVGVLDFPRMIERAWADGVRVFLEHGPRGLCSGWIRRILGEREHVAVSLDVAGRDGLRQLAHAAAWLIAGGVAVDRTALDLALGTEDKKAVGAAVRVAAHSPAVVLPALEVVVQRMPIAPTLVPVLAEVEPELAIEQQAASMVAPQRGTPAAPMTGIGGRVLEQRARVHALHGEFLAAQAAVHTQFLGLRQRMQSELLAVYAGRGTAPRAPVVAPRVTGTTFTREGRQPGDGRGAAPVVVAQGLPGITMDRAQLVLHAGGALSEAFDPRFAEIDQYARRVRMPMPPLLLADRVTGIAAEALGLGTGTVWTETDVAEDSWYLHEGRMPAGIMIESGQADLLLASWIGVDLRNRGERVYRLLGCELTYHGELPKPGDTLVYDIHIDGHAQQGDIRLFFFHYDCRIDGELRLSVRHGQAGFFTDAELADSGGILWDPHVTGGTVNARVDAPVVASAKRAFTGEELRAFAQGRAADCFGEGFEGTRAHVRTPRIQADKLLLLSEITEFAPEGGPWGRGYLRAEASISPDDWYFAGHFLNDPCMPGTLMFEGCVQAMSFYMAALGLIIKNDGGRFEPVAGQEILMRCRGQAIPSARRIVYELFVDELIAGPVPTLYADLLCTIDGLKAFHARRVGLRIVPDWPLETWERLPVAVRDGVDPARVTMDLRRLGGLRGVDETRPVASHDGFAFDYKSLLACAWGRPSRAFGPMYAPFDGPRRVARLPGPPYHFMTRVTEVSAPMGQFKAGVTLTAEYDVPRDAWYFAGNGHPTMPSCVLMEAALQPCGWLASYIGSALTATEDLLFRNLDGTGTVLGEVLPDAGTLRTTIKLLDVSRSAGIIIESFLVECFVGDTAVYRMRTVFGFFPRAAFENQAGLPVSDEDRARVTAASEFRVDLKRRPARYFNHEPRLPSPMLCMLDRITMFAAQGGRKGLGAARGEKDVDPAEWFFKAHFFQDPVQPGSLGIEALIQLLQWLMIERGLGEGVVGARFEPVMVGRACTWKYRGQVVPSNARITTEMEIVEIGEDARGVFAIGEGSLWVDGVRIYQVRELGMRIVADVDAPRRAREVLDPAVDGWLGDHRPTWTAPALPMMSMVDRLAGAVRGRVVELTDVAVHRWLVFPGGPVELRTVVEGTRVTLLAGNEPVAAGRVLIGEVVAKAPEVMPALVDAKTVEDPYASGALFHGPAFQMLRSLRVGSGGASAELDCAERGVPRGALHQGLLDALTHPIPHDELWRWSSDIDAGVVGYPCRIPSMRFFGEMPTSGVGRVEVRFAGFDGGPRFPRFVIQLIVDGAVRVALTLVEVLLPKGAIGLADRLERRAFLRDRRFVAGLGLAHVGADETVVTRAEVAASDWLPGNVARIYGVTGTDVLAEVAVRDHVAQRAGVHPSAVKVAADLRSATTAERPLRRHYFAVRRGVDGVRVAEDRPPARDLAVIEGFWREWLGAGAWPIEDLFLGLVDRFVGDVVLADPEGFDQKVRGRSCLYLANHQVGIESLLFSVIVSALSGAPAVTLAKHEHRQSWIGQLIAHSFDYPGVTDPGLIAFFERDDPASLKRILDGFVAGMARGSGVVVHVEGTRSLSCRQPVQTMSSVFLDMALTVGAPIVPVRFVGGLPVEPLEKRLEFPVGFGRQEFWIGGPIEPAQLRPLTLKDRKKLVIDAINGLGPTAEQELPGAPDPAFAEAVAAWQSRAAGPERATLLATLDGMTEHRSAATRRLVAEARAGQVTDGEDAAARWLARLARWLLGAG